MEQEQEQKPKHYILRQTLPQPVDSVMWEGGAKQVFDWKIDGRPQTDSKGQFIKIGSYSANYWFHVAVGKTEKLTLSYAKRRLKGTSESGYSKFEYVEVK